MTQPSAQNNNPLPANLQAYTIGEKDTRPWGTWEVLDLGTEPNAHGVTEEFCVKKITVNPGGVLSLQSHQLRREEWTVLEGLLEVTRNEAILNLSAGDTVEIPQGAVHRMANRSDKPAVVKEIQRGMCREDDIKRYEDIYGRDVS